MKRLLALLAALALSACGTPQPWVVPVPPPPIPTPIPVPPLPPNPNAGVAMWANVELVKVGMTRAEVDAALAVQPTFENPQDDGTRLVEWASVGPNAQAEYLSVHFGRDGKVMGRSRVPRAAPPTPPIASAELECPGGDCRVPGR